MGKEQDAIRLGWGKWSQFGAPHKGWYCEDTEDLGEPIETCEMCERVSIRYVHIMNHDEWFDEPLRCGCVCAGHMEEDIEGARNREATMRTRAGRRARFPKLKKWKRTDKGNERIDYRGRRVIIFASQGGYRVMLIYPDGREWRGRKTYPTAREAKLRVFDAAERAENKR